MRWSLSSLARSWMLAGTLIVASTSAPAADARVAASRERIDAERRFAEERFLERERACAVRFVTASCAEEAKRERRETLARLRDEQNRIEDDARRARAVQRAAAIRERLAAREARDAGRTDAQSDDRQRRVRAREEPRPAVAAAREPRLPRPARDPAPRRESRPAEDPVTRTDRETRRRAAFVEAQRAAAAHRAEVEARNARRSATNKPAPALPLPADSPR